MRTATAAVKRAAGEDIALEGEGKDSDEEECPRQYTGIRTHQLFYLGTIRNVAICYYSLRIVSQRHFLIPHHRQRFMKRMNVLSDVQSQIPVATRLSCRVRFFSDSAFPEDEIRGQTCSR